MMNTQLLEIQPRELKFMFELKKQSSCAIRLTNNTYDNVAFKVKTTSPKKYCVRPNVGIVMPKSTCEFTVTMQAQKAVPTDMVCKDKFLIQSTVVPIGTTDMDITASMFTKDGEKYIEEVKLRVVLISPPQSPVLSPINGVLNQGSFFESSVQKDLGLNKVETVTPEHTIANDVECKMTNGQEFNTAKDMEFNTAKDTEFNTAKDMESKPKLDEFEDQEAKPTYAANLIPDVINCEELKSVEINELESEIYDFFDKQPNGPKPANEAEAFPVKNVEFVAEKAMEEQKLVNDIEELKLKLNELETKLNEAESTISKLTEERRLSIQERKILQEELAVLRSRTSVKKVQVGFPLLFVVMVALIGAVLGYLSCREI